MMNQIMKMRKAKGFTLVELLIVIIIIGILAGMLLLAVGSATDKAEATKIVNALRNYKSAALMYYTDNSAWPGTGTTWEVSLDQYTDRSLDKTQFAGVTVAQIGTTNRFLIGLVAAAGAPLGQAGVQAKLAAQSAASALYSAGGTAYVAGTPSVFTNMR